MVVVVNRKLRCRLSASIYILIRYSSLLSKFVVFNNFSADSTVYYLFVYSLTLIHYFVLKLKNLKNNAHLFVFGYMNDLINYLIAQIKKRQHEWARRDCGG